MTADLQTLIGLRHAASMTVLPRHTVPEVAPDWPGFRDMPPVLATAMMVGFLEQTCIEALRPHLPAHQRSLGTGIAVNHIAPTPVGMTLTATVELVECHGRALRFRVSCADDAGLVGEGTHDRAIIDLDRFLGRLRLKANAAALPRQD
jgi:fluoroacetyl-CoA thioesterase